MKLYSAALAAILASVSSSVDEGACVIVKRFEPSETFQHTKDCEGGEENCKHDFFVEVWLNEGDKATSVKRTNVAHNQDSPVWNERLCWQSDMGSVNFKLYEDDYYSSQDTEFFVDTLTVDNSDAVRRRSRDDLRIGLKNSENDIIGVLYYGTDLDDDLWGFSARTQTCHTDSMFLYLTEPAWLGPMKGGWVNGPRKDFSPVDGEVVLLKRQPPSTSEFGGINLCNYDGKGFSAGYFFNTVAVLPWHHDGESECTHFEVVQKAEDAGAVGVIFYLSNYYEYGDLYMQNVMSMAETAPTATIPARWIEYDSYDEIRRSWDVHEIDQLYGHIICPWQYEETFMETMCISDAFFSGEYAVLKTEDDVTVTVNDHAVWKSSSLGGGLPTYVVNTKNIDANDLGMYRWVVSTSLSAEYLLGVCQTTHRTAEIMEPNDCENWEIYDKAYNQWQQHPLSIIDFCPTGQYDFAEIQCGHTAVQVNVDTAGPMTDLVRSYPSVVALFGPARYETGSVQLVALDWENEGNNGQGCDSYDANTKDVYGEVANVSGKIAVVSRGGCFFSLKQVKAEEAGAVGVIVVNYEGASVVYMAHSGTVAPGAIPARMMSYEDWKPLGDAMLQLGPIYPITGGFYCPQDSAEPPAELCIGQITAYSDDWGFHNDFHGTFVRLKKDHNDHAAYRLDPLSNDSLGANIYGTQTSGTIDGGIDHTKTYLYYDSGGVDDIGNAWKIGPSLGSGEEHIFAYCQGPLGEDITSPANCDVTGGTWRTYLPDYTPPDFYAINTSQMIYNGQCAWDMATGDGWHELPDFDGIFCKKHKNCQPNEYCMDCNTCLDKYASEQIFKGDMFTHPCSYCFYERDEDETGDDAICVPAVSCSSAEDASFRDADDMGDATMVCVDTCTIGQMGIDGECPDTPGCDEAACADTETLVGNGVCNSECAACPGWQVTPFDGSDCIGRELQLVEGQHYEFTGGEGYVNLVCSTVETDGFWGPTKVTIQMIGEVLIKKVNGSRITMEFTYEQVGEVDSAWEDEKRTLELDAVETSLVAWTATPKAIDMESAMKFSAFEGKIGKSEDYVTNKNPEGLYITMLPYSDANYGETSHLECREFILPMTDTKKHPNKDDGDDAGGDDSSSGGEMEDSTAKCQATEKKYCKNGKQGAAEANCEWRASAQKGKGGCLWVPPTAPVQEECLHNGDGEYFVKGKGWASNFKKQEARNMSPCACLLLCQSWYETRGPFVAFTLETGVKKDKDYAQCTCWRQLKKVNESAGAEFQTGSVIPGYLDAWMKKK